MVVLVGCRARMETSRSVQRERVDEIGAELHRVDSLWSSLAEKMTYKIEFYPYCCNDLFDTVQGGEARAACLGQGPVKSIEVTVEKTEGGTAVFKTDTAYNSQSSSKEIKHTANDSEAKQDNGAVAIVTVVLALAALAAIALILFKLKILKL